MSINHYLEKIANYDREDGYFVPGLVGAVAGAGSGALAGGSLGFAGGEMALDSHRQINAAKTQLNDFMSKVPFVKSNIVPIQEPSRLRSLANGVGRGLKYGAMAGAPLGASLFVYDRFLKNQEHQKMAEANQTNPYLEKIAATMSETAVDDARLGSKLGLLAGGAYGFTKGGIGGAVVGGAAGLLAGGAAGGIAGVPHHMLKDPSEVSRRASTPLLPTLGRTVKDDASVGAKIGAGIGGVSAGVSAAAIGAMIASDAMRNGAKITPGGVGKVGLGVLGAGALGALTGAIPGALFGAGIGVPHGAANSLVKDYHANRIEKSASWVPDSFAHQLGWEDPRQAALKSGVSALALNPSDLETSRDKVQTAALTAMAANSAYSDAVKNNRLIQEILEAQEHGVRTGDMSLHHELREDLLGDPRTSRISGNIAGALAGGMGGFTLANALGGNGLAKGLGAVAGAGLAGYGIGRLAQYSTEAGNENTLDVLARREARLNRLLTKAAEIAVQETPHDYKPALAAGAIDAAMGVGLGGLGYHISKKYFGGKYTPLIIGGLEGTAAMAATDLYQRKHERDIAKLKESFGK